MPSKWYRASKCNNIYLTLLHCYSLGILIYLFFHSYIHNLKHSRVLVYYVNMFRECIPFRAIPFIIAQCLFLVILFAPSHTAFLSKYSSLTVSLVFVSCFFFIHFFCCLHFWLKFTSICIYINISRIMIREFHCNYFIDAEC